MPRNNSEAESRHRHGGKGTVFAGLLIVILGLMSYYQFSWPLTVVTIGILIVVFGLFRMMK